MTKVECIFNLNSIEDAYLYLLDKFKNKKIFIFKKNNHSEVSEFLWKMQDRFFIHESENNLRNDLNVPILIGKKFSEKYDQILINLEQDYWHKFSRYEIMVELITNEDNIKEKARERMKQYQDVGYEIKYIDFKKLTQ